MPGRVHVEPDREPGQEGTQPVLDQGIALGAEHQVTSANAVPLAAGQRLGVFGDGEQVQYVRGRTHPASLTRRINGAGVSVASFRPRGSVRLNRLPHALGHHGGADGEP
ncbi:hypothetical protein GCM10027456_19950 [Kineosporia babensis]